MRNKKIVALIGILIFVVASLLIYFNRISLLRAFDYGIYSNHYHYLECDQLPSYTEAEKIFATKQDELLEYVKEFEREDKEQLNEDASDLYKIDKYGTVRGGFTSVGVNYARGCTDKGDIQATATSEEYSQKLIKFFKEELPDIPYNIRND